MQTFPPVEEITGASLKQNNGGTMTAVDCNQKKEKRVTHIFSRQLYGRVKNKSAMK